jgi:hypothetical protein
VCNALFHNIALQILVNGFWEDFRLQRESNAYETGKDQEVAWSTKGAVPYVDVDLDRQWDNSHQRGFGSKVWLVNEQYKLENGRITWGFSEGFTSQRMYYPSAFPELPIELAKVHRDDSRSTLSFVERWGILGEYLEIPTTERLGGESAAYLWEHAERVRSILSALHGTPPIDWDLSYESAPKLVATILSFELSQITIGAEATPNLGTTGPESIGLTINWSSLKEVVYYHVLALAGDTLGLCKECDNYYRRTHPRQEFCPPSDQKRREYDSLLKGRAQSKCALRYRMRIHRRGERKKG